MAKNNGTVQRHELEELQTRMDWVDEERRKSSRLVAQLEQRLETQERDLKRREQRIKTLETQLLDATTKLNRASQIDTTLQQFKDELVGLIEQYDQRRIQTADEAERMRRVEQEMAAREINEIRKELPEITRLRTDMELRQAEESRLANLIGKLQNRISSVENRIESWEREVALLHDKERQAARLVTEQEGTMAEMKQRLDNMINRVDLINSSVLKAEANIQDLTGLQVEVRQSMKTWMDQIQLGEYERNQRLENWRQTIEDMQQQSTQFNREWVTYADLYKEAQMTLQTLSEWQRQIEKQQQEQSEYNRVERGRMQTRWDNFLSDNEKRWRNFEVDNEQRAADGNRRDRQLEEQLYELGELIKVLQTEKDTLWRVQSAQLDAIKNFPRIWLEEVEKARERDPNRRRQPCPRPRRRRPHLTDREGR